MEEEVFLRQPWTLSQEEIGNVVRKASEQQIINAIELVAEKELLRLPKFCTLIFRGLAGANVHYRIFRATFFLVVRRWLLGQFHESVESSLLFVLLSEVDRLSPTDVMAMATNLVGLVDDDSKGNRLVHFLPKLFQCLDNGQDVETSQGTLKAYEARDCIMDKIVGVPSTRIAVLLLLAVWNELDLNDNEKDKLFERLMDCMVELNLDDIPNFVLKLLSLLASEANAKYIGRLLEVACSLTTRARYLISGMAAIRNAQSNIILHMMHTVRTQQTFGKTLLNAFKEPHLQPCARFLAVLIQFQNVKDVASSDFYLACLLCLSRLNRLQQKVQTLLKSSITESMKKKLNVKSSRWLRSILEFGSVEKTVDSLISYESDSWEYVIEGLCELGFTFLEVYPGRSIALKGSLQYELFSLGNHLITECFKHHHFIRRAVFERIMDAIMLQSPACDQLLRLFSALVKIAPMTVIENRARLSDAFQVLPLLPLSSSVRCVKALIAIIDFKPEIRFALFKSLRNAVFSKDLQARQTGIACFLLFLGQKDIINAFSASQSSSSSQSFPTFSSQQGIFSSNTRSSYLCVDTMFLELIGCFQRALRLQAELRRTLYMGLAKAASDHQAIREPVLDLLYRQLVQYLPDDKSNMPPIFSLDACAATAKDGAHLLEPVGTLISSITSLARENASNDPDGLGSLASHVADSQLEDFNLDKSVNYSPEETAGLKNVLLGYQFLAMTEALVEFSIFNFDDRKETAENMLKLYALWSKMEALLRERLGWRAQKRKLLAAESLVDTTTTTTKTNDGGARCCVSISAIVSLLSLMFRPETGNDRAISMLQSDENFVSWLFSLAQRRLSALDMELNRRKVFEDVCILAKLTLSYFGCDDSRIAETRQAPAIRYKALEIFTSCMDAINMHYSDHFEKSLSFLTEQLDLDAGRWEQMESPARFHHFSLAFLKMLVSNLSSPPPAGETEKPEKISELLMHMIEIFVFHIPPESTFYSQIFNNLLEICREQRIVETTVARRLWTMTLDMQKQVDIIPSSAISLAEQLHVIFGDITDGDLDGSAEFYFASVIPKTAPVVVQALLAQLESLLEDGIFALAEAKSIRLSALGDVTEKEHAETSAGDIERGVCDIFCLVLLAWHELIQSRIPLKLVDSTVKGLERMFKALTLLSKHYLMMCSKKLLAAPEESFQKLTKKSGTRVTNHVYKLISYVQSENGNSRVLQLNSTKAKDKTIREMKSLSSLVFAIETYEESLIQLSAKCKTNFMLGMKPSVNRDFRIDVNRVRAAFHHDTVEEGQTAQEASEGRPIGDSSTEPKRRRRD